MRVLTERLKGRDLDLLDGIKVNDRRGWAQVLPDPDEPLVHIYAEGRDERGLERARERAAGSSSRRSCRTRQRPQVEVEPLAYGCFTSQRSPPNERRTRVEPLPDLTSMSDDDLKKLIDELTEEEQEISYRRRLLHGKIDILRAELVARLQKSEGKSVLEQVDVEGLARDPGGQGVAAERGTRLSHIYCPECGFQNPEVVELLREVRGAARP